jgi:hypothetical protein
MEKWQLAVDGHDEFYYRDKNVLKTVMAVQLTKLLKITQLYIWANFNDMQNISQSNSAF